MLIINTNIRNDTGYVTSAKDIEYGSGSVQDVLDNIPDIGIGDVIVNGESTVINRVSDIKIKTINGKSILGIGDLEVTGEPEQYLKDASLSGNTIIITKKDNTIVSARASSWTPTKNDIGLGNVENFKAVSTVASQNLTDTEKSNARANIGAGTSSFSGDYDDLTSKPNIPTETTVSTWGFTKNTGTVTSVAVKINGETKGTITTSGTIDLGTISGGEPEKYLKDASVLNEILTLTKKDDATVTLDVSGKQNKSSLETDVKTFINKAYILSLLDNLDEVSY